MPIQLKIPGTFVPKLSRTTIEEPKYDGTFWGKPHAMFEVGTQDRIKMAFPDGWRFVKFVEFETNEMKSAIVIDEHGNKYTVENKNAFRIPAVDTSGRTRSLS